MEELLQEIINIVKWTEEGIRYNNLKSTDKTEYQSYTYEIIKNKIEEVTNGRS